MITFLMSFGKAPFALACIAVLSSGLAFATRPSATGKRPDLVFVTFAKNHMDAYKEVIPGFEQRTGKSVKLMLVGSDAIGSRLRAAMEIGAEVPDVIEMSTIAPFVRGPVADVGFMDLTERVKQENLDERMVASRFAKWSSRGHIFGLPHDVHPVMLAYRQSVVDELGIDVSTLTTWDKLAEAGRKLKAEKPLPNGAGNRYIVGFNPNSAGDSFEILLLQAGGGMFDAQGNVTFDNEIAVKTMTWLVQNCRGETKIGSDPGWGQPLSQNFTEGRVIFVFTPDWRTKLYQLEMPQFSGDMRVMPMPAWTEGGRRTSCWGGTGCFITKNSKDPELAWEFVKSIYLDESTYGKRFLNNNIIPPVKSTWAQPELNAPYEYYGGQRIGALYSGLAIQTPPQYTSADEGLAGSECSAALVDAGLWYDRTNDVAGLEAKVRELLKARATYVRSMIARNRFLVGTGAAAATPAADAAPTVETP